MIPIFVKICILNVTYVSNFISIFVLYSTGNYATFGGTLKFPEFLFVNTAICANFLLEKSGIEFSCVSVNFIV